MSDDGHIDTSFTCTACGAPILWKEDVRDDEMVTCPDCGAKGPTFRELKSAALEASKKAVEDVFGQKIDWKPE